MPRHRDKKVGKKAGAPETSQIDDGLDQELVSSAGVLFARRSRRFARGGERIGKIAGTMLSRTGNLLSP